MKKKVLFIFKYPHGHWNEPINQRFSNYYETFFIYINDYKNKNFKEIVEEINNIIVLKKIDITVFDVDYFKFINYFFIQNIKTNKKILITGDDFDQHQMNSITASACDIVLSACPLSVLKFREKGFEAFYIPFESGEVVKNTQTNKDIDVLFFGELTPDRNEFIDYIKEKGINIKNVGFNKNGGEKLTQTELNQLISKTKIILNLSKTKTVSVKNHESENIYKSFYQFKGRIWDSAKYGVLCLSEYSPGQQILFNDNELPTFFSKEECVQILKKLLMDNDILQKFTDNFIKKSQQIFDEKKNFQSIFKSIEQEKNRKVDLILLPYWYLRIVCKQILLRNLKLKNLVKATLQFDLVLKIVKKSSFLVKILIILESIINIFWYSIIYSLKLKK